VLAAGAMLLQHFTFTGQPFFTSLSLLVGPLDSSGKTGGVKGTNQPGD